jgi:phytanoyl-CoA hydroxylase
MLTEEQVTHFHQQGYLIVRGVLDEGDLSPVRSEYSSLLSERASSWGVTDGDGSSSDLPFETRLLELSERRNFDPSMLSELDITLPHMPFTAMRADTEMHVGTAILGLLTNPRILDAVGSLLGEEISASPNQHCRLKLPLRGDPGTFGGRKGETMHAPTMWHQDAMTQMPQSDDTEVITCWIPLDDVEEIHGCLTVVPGLEYLETLLPWPLDETTIESLEELAVPLPARKGDIVLLHKRVPHGSRLNRSDRVRWSFDFRYYPSSQPSDRPWFPSIVARSQARPDSVQTDAEAWRRRWKSARDHLAEKGEPLPGRREFAQMVAEALIKRWEEGDFETPPMGAGHAGAGAQPEA